MRRLAGVALAVTLAATGILVVAPTPTSAVMSENEQFIRSEVNAARIARGLAPLRGWSRLSNVAGDRASVMAARNVLSHTVAGSLTGDLARAGVSWSWMAETIAYNTATRGRPAARALVRQWRESPSHWTLLMSSRPNYIGVGIAYRSSNGRTYGAVVLTKSPNHNSAAAPVSVDARIARIRWTSTTADRQPRTRTAHLLDISPEPRRASVVPRPTEALIRSA